MFSPIVLALVCTCLTSVPGTSGMVAGGSGNYEVVYSWASLDYTWANDTMEEEYIRENKFQRQTNLPSAIKVYKGEVYVTVPRFFGGVPATINKVVLSADNAPLLQPFPNWDAHTIGDCKSFQFIQAMEIDPNTGWMWIVDTGRSGVFNPGVTKNSCPAKIIIYDLNNDREIRRYEFPEEVVGNTTNYINDIVLEYVGGKAANAYMTDTGKPGLVVYNFEKNLSYRFEDDATMSAETDKPIIIDGTGFDPNVPINGIAMSADFRYVYFSPVSGVSLYQVPTEVLRNPAANISAAIRKVGEKASQSDGMMYGKQNLYFGGLNDSSLYRWEVAKDVKYAPATSEGEVTLRSVDAILRNVSAITWIDTFAIDESGYLWFTSANVGRLFLGSLNYTASTPNFRIMKTRIDELSYLNLKVSAPGNTANSLATAQLFVSVLFTALIHRIF